MMIPPELVDQIRQAVDIVEVIDGYVPLKRAGSTYKALSPFNKEKTPSFFVNPQKQIFKCFSSGNGGDVFKFIMLYENVDFPTAVRKMAEKAGIPIPEQDGTFDKTRRESRGRLLALHAEISTHWRELLLHDPRAQKARAYLKDREIPLAWAKEYGLGFAPEAWDDTVAWARANKFEEELLHQAGLVKRHEESGRIYDFFRGRLIFPIANESGEVIAFSARLLDPEAKAAKYVNSPETPLFTKSRVLFGFHRAKRAILDADRVVVCEGQIDVLRCHAAGILNVVAPLGTSFTEDHARILRRFTRNVIICLDADNAGQKAAERVVDTMLGLRKDYSDLARQDLGIKIVQLPTGHDPDSFIKEQGAENFMALCEKAVDFIDFYVSRLIERNGRSSPEAKRKSVDSIVEFLIKIPNEVYREQQSMKVARLLEVSEQSLREVLKSQLLKNTSKKARKSSDNDDLIKSDEREDTVFNCDVNLREIFQLIVNKYELIPDVLKKIALEWVEDCSGYSLLKLVVDAYNDDALNSVDDLYGLIGESERIFLESLKSDAFEKMDLSVIQQHLDVLADKTRLLWVVGEMRRVIQRLKAEGLTESERQELIDLQTRLHNEKNRLTSIG